MRAQRCVRVPPRVRAAVAGGVGCVGAMALDCRNGISGFVPMKRGKVPDTTAIVVDFGAILADCAQRCPRDCSCTAYASAKLSGTPRTSTLEDLRVFPNFSQEPRTSMCAFRCRSRYVPIFLCVPACLALPISPS